MGDAGCAEILAAFVAALVATSAELRWEHDRFPVGTSAGSAFGFWALLVAIDGVVAVLAVLTVLDVQVDVQGAEGIFRAAVVGLVGPLGLRSPVRRASVGGTQQSVGVTYVYDLLRYRVDWVLDERMTRLRRRDVAQSSNALISRGLLSKDAADLVSRHIRSRRRLTPVEMQDIQDGLEASLTLPSEDDRMEALVNVLHRHRLHGILKELSTG